MMRRKNIILIAALLIIGGQSFGQDFLLAESFGGSLTDIGHAIAVDAEGNIYCTGTFKGTADFDPGAGVFNLTSHGDNDIFITKTDEEGNFLWAKGFGGGGIDYVFSMALDKDANIYTCGNFTGTADFDPGAATVNLTSNGMVDIFISKLDMDGNFIWAQSLGAEEYDEPLSIKTDDAGNIYTAGYYYGEVDFDAGPSTNSLTAVGGYDVFILKLDEDGNYIWAKSMGGTGWDFAFSVALDNEGNIYSTGYFASTADFDPGDDESNLTSAGNYDVFISKLDADGNYVWVKRVGGSDVDYGFVVATDNEDNVYVTGSFYSTPDFDPGAGVYELSSAGAYDIFYLKLDSEGNFIWAKNTGGPLFDYVNSMVVDAAGDFYSTGYFQGTSDFDAGADEMNISVVGMDDIFIQKSDANGNLLWVKTMGSATNDIGISLCLDNEGNIATLGYYTGTVDFDPGAGTTELTSAGDIDTYVLKLTNTVVVTSINSVPVAQANVYPNPGSGNFMLTSDQIIRDFKIYSSEGKLIYQNEPLQRSVNFNIGQCGIYFIQLNAHEETQILKLVVEK